MFLPRTFHRLYAKIVGYFWLPCPICGRYFGGHEWQEGCSICSEQKELREAVCSPTCAVRYYDHRLAQLNNRLKKCQKLRKEYIGEL